MVMLLTGNDIPPSFRAALGGMKDKAAMTAAAAEAEARRGPEKTQAQKNAATQGLPCEDDGRVSPGTSVMRRLDSMKAIDARAAFSEEGGVTAGGGEDTTKPKPRKKGGQQVVVLEDGTVSPVPGSDRPAHTLGSPSRETPEAALEAAELAAADAKVSAHAKQKPGIFSRFVQVKQVPGGEMWHETEHDWITEGWVLHEFRHVFSDQESSRKHRTSTTVWTLLLTLMLLLLFLAGTSLV